MNDWLYDAIDYFFADCEPEDEELSDSEKLVLIYEFIKFERAKAEQRKLFSGRSMFGCP